MKKNNYAYIDGNNLYRGVSDSGWKIDFFRFRKWLSDKYGVTKAYYFIGLIPKEKDLYTSLQESGYTLIFKEVVYDSNGRAKGNCDADFVLQSVVDVYENNCEKQILITSDGDYAGLVKFLQTKNKLRVILSPSIEKKCSILLKRTNAPITYLRDVYNKISLKRKNPH
ncbi:MAG: NYN domain-containing protein [Patescibacteria group bacterium]|nr:NYN domain-containing protein [Patescibacteria group bacterium]